MTDNQPESNGPPGRIWVDADLDRVFDFELSGFVPYLLSTPAREHAEEMERALEKAGHELAALVPNPDSPNPNWMLALGNENPADVECLNNAYEAIRAVLAKVRGTE